MKRFMSFAGAAALSLSLAAGSAAAASLPEPSTWLMFGAGVAAIGFAGRRRKHA